VLNHLSLSTIRRRWVTVVTAGLLGALVAFLLSTMAVPMYRSTASMFFTLNFGTSANELNQGSNYTANQMLSFGELATAPVVLNPVITELELETTAQELAKSITISTPRDTVIMSISAVSDSPQEAADIANAVAARAGEVIENFAPQTTAGKPSVLVRTIARATPAPYQFSPNKKLNTAAGLGVGTLFGVLLAFILAGLDNRIRNAESLVGPTFAPYLGSLRKRAAGPGREVVVLQESASQGAEEYRQLRSNLLFATMGQHPLVVVVSSSVPNEGKSTVSSNLAAVLAESGQRVLLIDADLRKPSVAEYTQLADSVGLSEVLVGVATLHDAVQPLGSTGVDVLVGGSLPPNPGELVASTHMTDVLTEAKLSYDVVVVDTAPILAVADALSLTQRADGLLLVARSGVTTKSDLELSLSTIRGGGGTVFGVAINGSTTRSDRSLRDYQYYTEKPEAPSASTANVTPLASRLNVARPKRLLPRSKPVAHE